VRRISIPCAATIRRVTVSTLPCTTTYSIAVRSLCEFAAKRGDLDMRFTPSPTAQEGIAGHTLVAQRRQAPYQAEVPLVGSYLHLEVKGRADGYDPDLNQLEEVKTYRGYVENIAANHRALHWAQAKVYAWLMCEALSLEAINVALVYFSIDTEIETVIVEKHQANDLKTHFEGLCAIFIDWSKKELQHQASHRNFAAMVQFPFPELHAGQRVLAESVFRAATSGRALIAQAPTGIGKTIGTLFPVLKTGLKDVHKVFYLAAKTSGRSMALSALQTLGCQTQDNALRTLELTAKDKVCEHPDKACHGESCPLAKGFYDRLPTARNAATERAMLTKDAIREVALAHNVCPYYLSQEMVRWVDVVVCDYNYYFDLSAMLFGLTVNNQWKIHLLVDEAHNLPDRARAMYSAELTETSLRAVVFEMPDALKKDVDRFRKLWRHLFKDQTEDISIIDELSEKFVLALDKLLAAISALLADDTINHAVSNPAMQAFFLEGLHFQKVLALFDKHFFIEANRQISTKTSCLRIHNVLPAPMLKTRFAAAHSTTLFSATLNPANAYQQLLGLPDNAVAIDVESPFDGSQLTVNVTPRISTRFKDRQSSLGLVVQTIAAQYTETPGNYLAFFSSFDYLQQASERMAKDYPDLPIWKQSRGMSEQEREAFLARFTATSSGVGFAVLGGAFSEGIDLPGARLIGAFIATLGLPQFNVINDEMKRRIDDLIGNGYEYIYLYPGLQKVVQAAGRVIRTKQDRGVVFLMDDRFCAADVQTLLPSWWKIISYR
jgi:DNA excision repair protein ERCC-2